MKTKLEQARLVMSLNSCKHYSIQVLSENSSTKEELTKLKEVQQKLKAELKEVRNLFTKIGVILALSAV